MGGLVEIFLSLCGVCEAEGRALRENALLVARRLGIASLAVVFLGAGLALLLAALYSLLAMMVAGWLVFALVGLAALGMAGALFMLASRGRPACSRDQERPAADNGKAANDPEDPASELPPGERQKEACDER